MRAGRAGPRAPRTVVAARVLVGLPSTENPAKTLLGTLTLTRQSLHHPCMDMVVCESIEKHPTDCEPSKSETILTVDCY